MRCISGVLGITLLSLGQLSYADLRIIVKYKQPTVKMSLLSKLVSQSTQLPVNSITPMAGDQYVLSLNTQNLPSMFTTDKAKIDWVLKQVRQNPDVAYAVKDRVGHFKPVPTPKVAETPINLSHDIQWNEFLAPGGVVLETAAGRRDGAWAHTMGESNKPIIVAVLDTGFALHESLVNSYVKEANGSIWGWNFAGNNTDISDETKSYHGTHVAGIIAGYGNVMSGVGSYLKILPLKIPDAGGMFYESQVINAMYWAVGKHVPGIPDNPYPAKVLNMSFGIDVGPNHELEECDIALQETVSFVKKQGAVLMVAAGNDNLYDVFNAPAVCEGTIRVAATGPEGLRAFYSNYGRGITYAAPGGDMIYGREGGILSTVKPGGGYEHSGFDFYQGTSMASPHAAGIAGLVYAVRGGDIAAEQVEQILWATTHDFGVTRNRNKSCVGKKPCGHGILDANNAVRTATANYDMIFSAPILSSDDLKACDQGFSIPKQTSLMSGYATWKQTSRSCQLNDAFLRPVIKQKGHRILAIYGSSTYQLDTSGFKECHVIGFDGIGCYL